MNKRGLDKSKARYAQALKLLKTIENLPPSANEFESIWYNFLTNFNNVFSQLEQASKTSETSKLWYSEVKKLRKFDPLLSYLHHARNFEEHTNLSSVFKTDFILKPLTKGLKVEYRDVSGLRLKRPRIKATVGADPKKVQIIPPGYMLRTVLDRGVTFEFPKKYSNKILDELVANGDITLKDSKVPFTGMLKVAMRQLELILDDASALTK